MKAIFVLSTCCLLVTGCGDKNHEPRATNHHTTVESSDQRIKLVTPDDQKNRLKTAQDQSESEGDRRITQQARQAVVNRSDLSTNAKNVKIITIERVVQLRGAVDNNQEREVILELIKVVPGVQRVDDQLEVGNQGE